MVDSTGLSLALWPCLELLRQYELLRVRSYYEDLCESLMRREACRARNLIRKKEGTAQQDEELPGGAARASQNAASVEDRLEFLSDLTPKESFNRWLMECRSTPVNHADPLIPSVQHAFNARESFAEASGLKVTDSEHVEDFDEPSSSAKCATGLHTAAKAVTESETQIHKKRRVQGLNNEEHAEENAVEWTKAVAISDFGRSPMKTLEREILEDLPMKVVISSTAAKTRAHLAEYAQAVSAVMLSERQKVECVSPAALSPLVEALLVLLSGERGDSPRDIHASPTGSFDTQSKEAAHLLTLLSSELQQHGHVRGSTSPHRDARGSACTGVRRGELQGVGSPKRYARTISGEELPTEIWGKPGAFSSENLRAIEAPCVIRRRRAPQLQEGAHSDDDAGMRSVSKNFSGESYSSYKDDVYHMICLARPVVSAIYGDKVRALVKHVEEAAQQAAARVAQYAECLTVEAAAGDESSAHRLGIPTLHTTQIADTHSVVGDANVGSAIAQPKGHCIKQDAFDTTVTATRGDRSMPGNNSAAREETAVGTKVSVRTEAGFHKGIAVYLNTSVPRHHSVIHAVEDESLRQPLENFWRPPSRGSKGHVVFNNILWFSCRIHERFMYGGDVEMLARDQFEFACTNNFRSFKVTYSVKSYKVVQLWARFMAEKLEQEDTHLVEAACMRMECVCKGRGVRDGDWTCSCVRKQIRRIQSSAYADIDKFFGSKGSFFDPNFTITEGSYEANPPFEEMIMNRVVSRVEQWLDASGEERNQTGAQSPLSFCLLVPYWPEGPSQYMSTLTSSKYMRFSTVLPEKQHYFLSGFQHFCPTAETAKAAVCKTLFAVLQNEEGARKWPVTPDIIEQIKATWKPGSTSSAIVSKKRGELLQDSELAR